MDGALVSRIYRRPEGLTPFEVYRRYLDSPQQRGFEILPYCRAPDCNLHLSITPVYRRVVRERDYDAFPMSTDVYLTGLAEHYLSARKTMEDRTDHAVIRPESAEALEVIAAYLEARPGTRYYLVGHTDDTADLQANLLLPRNRAAGVAKALTEREISTGQLSTQGVGPFSPVASNTSEIGRSVNRRVELELRLD